MDDIALINKAGLRILGGHDIARRTLSAGQNLVACDVNGTVYRIAIGDGRSVSVEVAQSLDVGSLRYYTLYRRIPVEPIAGALHSTAP